VTIAYSSHQRLPSGRTRPEAIRGIEIAVQRGMDVQQQLDGLCRALSQHFNIPCRLADWPIHTEAAYVPRRGQYSAEVILQELMPEGEERVLGLVDVDLYVEPYEYVVGLAHPRKHRVLVALPRLRLEAGSGQASERDLWERVAHEAVHQLSHTYSPDPCDYTRCVHALVHHHMQDAGADPETGTVFPSSWA
jgi:predicted Zn-dependent protease